MSPIPGMPPGGPESVFFSGFSATTASVVRRIVSMLAAVFRAMRTTWVGAITPSALHYFGTPHGFGFERAAQLFGLDYANPADMSELNVEYANATSGAGSTVIEIRTDRDQNPELHRLLMADVVRAVDGTLDS